ncbi:MAG: glycosyltransferase family 2 protein [Ignavibacteriales bacterium]|nr:glycosyltransferase family 2 protein [Ignavibacteriales bacterium]
MYTQNKISAIIITGNEENNIKDCLKSVQWADEIIVVDSESTDKTVEIAKDFTDKVFIRKWSGYSSQKTYALSLATNDWVLSIDADERVSEELSKEILGLDLNLYSGYYIKRDNYFLDKLIRGCGWGNDMQLRLFKKSEAKLSERMVHEKFIVNGSLANLKNSFAHYSYKNLNDAFTKINNYSTLEANEKVDKKTVNLFTLLISPAFYFLHHFIIRRGFLDGIHGIIISYMHMVTKLQVQLKIMEIKKNRKS